jgi:hypothetical protein
MTGGFVSPLDLHGSGGLLVLQEDKEGAGNPQWARRRFPRCGYSGYRVVALARLPLGIMAVTSWHGWSFYKHEWDRGHLVTVDSRRESDPW